MPGGSQTGRWQVGLVAVVIVASGVWFWAASRFDPSVAFLDRRDGSDWIEYPLPRYAAARPAMLELRADFRREFRLEQLPGRAVLRIRGFQNPVVHVNETEVALPAGDRSWKHVRKLDVAEYLEPGENTLRVSVFNMRGPPALWLVLDAGNVVIRSDERWTASLLGSIERPARRAGDTEAAFEATDPLTRLIPEDLVQRVEQPRPWKALARLWPGLLVFGLFGAAAAGLMTFGAGAAAADSFSGGHWTVALVAVAILWGALGFHNHPLLAPFHGFDSADHVDYIGFIQEHRRLPLPDEGKQTFQTPLFYGSSAALLGVIGLDAHDPAAAAVLRGVTLLLGVAQIGLILLILRQLFPQNVRRQLFGLALAAFLPVHFYMFQYVTNEGMASVLMLGSVYLCLRALRSEKPSAAALALLGVVAGLAVLAKLTAVLLVAVVLGIVGLHAAGRRVSPAGVVKTAGVFLLVTIAVCGWYFAFVWSEFGRPVIGGWDSATQYGAWWQDPGRQTADYFFGFGESLALPRMAGFESFADGLYSTLWGDALGGGVGSVLFRPPWNEQAMAAGYLLSLLPSFAMLVGAVAAIRHWYRRRSLSWLLVLGLAFAMFFGLIHLNLTVPFIASPKIFYGLSAMACLCAFGAWGLDLLAGQRKWSSILIVAALSMWAGNSYLTYWIDGEAPRTVWMQAQPPGGLPTDDAARALERSLENDPHDAEAQFLLGVLHKQAGRRDHAAARFEEALRLDPHHVESRLEVCANAFRLHGIEAAIQVLEAVPPDADASPEFFRFLGRLYEQAGRDDEALHAYRHVLALNPFDVNVHLWISAIYTRTGDPQRALEHQAHANAVQPM